MKESLILKLIDMLVNSDDTEKSEVCNDLIDKAVIVRCRDAGVHFGYYVSHKGREVKLKRTRRMWQWWSKKQMTLSAVAEFGLNKEKDIRIQNELKAIVLLDACEIIPCSQACVESFDSVEPYDEQ